VNKSGQQKPFFGVRGGAECAQIRDQRLVRDSCLGIGKPAGKGSGKRRGQPGLMPDILTMHRRQAANNGYNKESSGTAFHSNEISLKLRAGNEIKTPVSPF